jgi:hypothetical protein
VVARLGAQSKSSRQLSFAVVVALFVTSAVLSWFTYSAARDDLRTYARTTAEVTVTGVEGSDTLARPGPYDSEFGRTGHLYKYAFVTSDARIPARVDTFWSAKRHGLHDRVRLEITIMDWGLPPIEGAGEPDPLSTVLFGLAVLSAMIGYWAFRILRRVPGLVRVDG